VDSVTAFKAIAGATLGMPVTVTQSREYYKEFTERCTSQWSVVRRRMLAVERFVLSLAPLGEKVARNGVLISRCGPGEGVSPCSERKDEA
jgi:hypothetical protein